MKYSSVGENEKFRFLFSLKKICLVILCLLISGKYNLEILAIDVGDENGGCYYNSERYEEGDQILTNEPCLNCTCRNAMLMCYLKVCPYIKDIDHECIVERSGDHCCPLITCPNVSMKTLESSTTLATTSLFSKEIAIRQKYGGGCTMQDNKFYASGAMVPSNPKEPCELCYCIHNYTACIMQECTLHIEGCKPVYQDGVCCPVRYDCTTDYIPDSKLTYLHTADPLLLSTSTSTGDCYHKGIMYSDGELIVTDKPCEHCYCMRGDIVCAIENCGPSLSGKNCIPSKPPINQCCPTSYLCAGEEQIPVIDYGRKNLTKPVNFQDLLLYDKEHSILQHIINTPFLNNMQQLDNSAQITTSKYYAPVNNRQTTYETPSKNVSNTTANIEDDEVTTLLFKNTSIQENSTESSTFPYGSMDSLYSQNDHFSESIGDETMIPLDIESPNFAKKNLSKVSVNEVILHTEVPSESINTSSYNYLNTNTEKIDTSSSSESKPNYDADSITEKIETVQPSKITTNYEADSITEKIETIQPLKSTTNYDADSITEKIETIQPSKSTTNYDADSITEKIIDSFLPSKSIPNYYENPSTEKIEIISTLKNSSPNYDADLITEKISTNLLSKNTLPPNYDADSITDKIETIQSSKITSQNYATDLITEKIETIQPVKSTTNYDVDLIETHQPTKPASNYDTDSITEKIDALQPSKNTPNYDTDSITEKIETLLPSKSTPNYDTDLITEKIETVQSKSTANYDADLITEKIETIQPSNYDADLITEKIETPQPSSNYDANLITEKIETLQPSNYDANSITEKVEIPQPSKNKPNYDADLITEKIQTSLPSKNKPNYGEDLITEKIETLQPQKITTNYNANSITEKINTFQPSKNTLNYDSYLITEKIETFQPSNYDADSITEKIETPQPSKNKPNYDADLITEKIDTLSSSSENSNNYVTNHEDTTFGGTTDYYVIESKKNQTLNTQYHTAGYSESGIAFSNGSSLEFESTTNKETDQQEHTTAVQSEYSTEPDFVSISNSSINIKDIINPTAPHKEDNDANVLPTTTELDIVTTKFTNDTSIDTENKIPLELTTLASNTFAEHFINKLTHQTSTTTYADTSIDTTTISNRDSQIDFNDTLTTKIIQDNVSELTTLYVTEKNSPTYDTTKSFSSTTDSVHRLNTSLQEPVSVVTPELNSIYLTETTIYQELVTTATDKTIVSSSIDTDTSSSTSKEYTTNPSRPTWQTTIKSTTEFIKPTDKPFSTFEPQSQSSPKYNDTTRPTLEEYDDTFGSGTCKYGGKIYATAQQIPRGNPCDFCFCFRSEIICLQQNCPPPISGCQQEIIDGFCCPRFECPLINLTTTTTTTTTTTPAPLPLFKPELYRNAGRRAGCVVRGFYYRIGDNIPAFSGPCLACICGSKGRMKCDPKPCSPEPLLRHVAQYRRRK